MTDKELRDVYANACSAKGFEPNSGQFKVWKLTLGWCEECDLAQAVTWYYMTNTAFPMPAELKPLAERSRQQRLARAQSPKQLVRWECPECGIYASAYIDPQDYNPRICQGIPREATKGERMICGAVMVEVHREAA
jgi:hypothetical protein